MLRVKTVDRVGQVIFDRPDQKNAFSFEMYARYADALSALDHNEQVAVVVVRGEGPDFCAGNDLNDFVNTGVDAALLGDPHRSAPARAVLALMNTKKPLLAAVEGRAIGFGATMLLHFDYVALSETSSLVYPFVDLGLVPEAGSSVLLCEQVGRRRATEMLLDPRPVEASSALALGLASAQTPPGETLAHVLAVAERWAGRPVHAMTRTKALLQSPTETLRAQIGHEFRQLATSLREPATQQRLQSTLNRSSGRRK